MDLLAAIRAVRRWWWLTMLLLATTGAGLFATNAALPWTYQATADVLFLASRAGAKEVGGNPYLQFADALNVSAEALGRIMMDDRIVADMRRRGFTSEYTIAPVPDITIPVLEVVVTGSDSGNVQRTLDALVAEIPRKLDSVQGPDQPAAMKIRARTVAASQVPVRDPVPKIRSLVILLGLGTTISIGLPVMVEARRERSRAAAEGVRVVWPLAGHERAAERPAETTGETTEMTRTAR
jgi:hypothetical protein